MLMSFRSYIYLPLVLCITQFVSALEIGSTAPYFSLSDSTGKKWNSEDFLNRKHVLVFFYPAAMTGGCTRQVCSYQVDFAKWNSKGFEIVGISGDKPENLSLFKKAENLGFRLLSDWNGKTAKKFGVPINNGGSIQKFIQGERYTLERGITAKRWTFIISKTGKVIYKNSKVNAGSDSADAFNFISNL